MDIFVHGLKFVYVFLQLQAFLFLYVQGLEFNAENMKPTRTVSSRLAYSVCEQRHMYADTKIVQEPVKIRPMTYSPVPCGWFKLMDNQIISFRKCVPNSYPGKINRKNSLLSGRIALVKQRKTTPAPEPQALVPSTREPSTTKKSPIKSIIKGYLRSNFIARKANMITPAVLVPTTKASRLISMISNLSGNLNNNYSIPQNVSAGNVSSTATDNSTGTLHLENRNHISTIISVITEQTTTTRTSIQKQISSQASFAPVQNETSTMSNETDVASSSVHYEDPHYEILSQEKSLAVMQRGPQLLLLCITAANFMLLHVV